MDRLEIQGGAKLSGTAPISGAKNSALPILISGILTRQSCRFERIPALQDVTSTIQILKQLGATVSHDGPVVTIHASGDLNPVAPYDLVRKMRASFLVLGPLLARHGKARVSLPGGCAIGARPVGFHLDGLKALGAEIDLEEGDVVARAPRGLQGGGVEFPFPSVGATEHLMMAASLARGEVELKNCAQEPEIVDLARALQKMGVKVEGAGSETIHVLGKQDLGGVDSHPVIGDRIEAITFLSAGLITRGKVRVEGVDPKHIESVLGVMEKIGARIEVSGQNVSVDASASLQPQDIETAPFPGFPTDGQAQLMAVLCTVKGESRITENVFENRFMHVQELARMGAKISIEGKAAVVSGGAPLKGAPVMATDLRASACLVVAGLAAEGTTVVNRIYHLDRGYERIEEKLTALGAKIRRV